MGKKKEVRKKRKLGFTLIELMIVIAIIAILASIAIPQYMRYQRKAKVASYALPIARGCAMDIVSYCVENPGQNVNATELANCANQTPQTAGGQVTLTVEYTGQCQNDGSVAPGDVDLTTAELTGVTDYQAVCRYKNAQGEQSLVCTVEAVTS